MEVLTLKELIYPVGEEGVFIPISKAEVEYVVQLEQEESDEEKYFREKFQSVKATLEIEGFVVTKEIEQLIKDKVLGRISEEEFLKRADEL